MRTKPLFVPKMKYVYSEFPCGHCAGMGYIDYPSNTKPCPIDGHYRAALEWEQSIELLKRFLGGSSMNL
jgi:hypothetical protein